MMDFLAEHAGAIGWVLLAVVFAAIVWVGGDESRLP